MVILYCPHCDSIIEVEGTLRPREPQCETCGAILEVIADLAPAKAFQARFDAVFGPKREA